MNRDADEEELKYSVLNYLNQGGSNKSIDTVVKKPRSQSSVLDISPLKRGARQRSPKEKHSVNEDDILKQIQKLNDLLLEY